MKTNLVTLYRPFGIKKLELIHNNVHQELWVPAAQMQEFNENIIGAIRVVKAFYGANYQHGNAVEKLVEK
jgi:hypothetical protein